jgi:nuclear protein localization family protein 4
VSQVQDTMDESSFVWQDESTGAVAGEGGRGGVEVVCVHCTFVNPAGTTDCEICGLPVSG